MEKKEAFPHSMHRLSLLFLIIFFFLPGLNYAEEAPTAVEINGDQVQYGVGENKVVANGNVIVKKDDMTLYCDRLEFDRAKSIGTAEGHVIFEGKEGRFTGDKMVYNFETMKGEFIQARIYSKPYYGGGNKVNKVGENHIVMEKGYITTCDLDKPHFRLQANKVDIYQGDKAVAKNVKFMLGNMPIIFIPRFSQSLKDDRPAWVITPGYKKDWGSFLLGQYRYYFNENLKATLHLDYRARKGWAEGLDLDYNTKKFGSGTAKIFYTDEHNSDSKYFFRPSVRPVTQTERFLAEWRHKWDIDPKTMAIWQYYRASDVNVLKDYFRRQYEEDSTPPTYFLLTRGLPTGTLSFQINQRVNRFLSSLDRVPEINYTMPDQQIFGSGFYWQDNTTYTNLSMSPPSPTENRQETMRINTDNTISYPFKVKFIELRPFVGTQQTFYSKTLEKKDNNSVRGIFRTGASMSTKFFRVYNLHSNLWGMDLHRLRHVLTPSVAYFYSPDPTLPSSKLVQFDAVDNQDRRHGMTFSLENKLQTKRDGQSVDLLRLILDSDFYLKEDRRKGGFNNVRSKIDFHPTKWVSLYSESSYDTIEDHLSFANADVYINDPKGRWYTSLGKRWNRLVDDQITSETGFRLNQKWWFRIYQRFDAMHGNLKEQEYALVRDLHEWEMKVTVNQKKDLGDEAWIVFTLKDFPDLSLDFGSGYNRVKPGRQ